MKPNYNALMTEINETFPNMRVLNVEEAAEVKTRLVKESAKMWGTANTSIRLNADKRGNSDDR